MLDTDITLVIEHWTAAVRGADPEGVRDRLGQRGGVIGGYLTDHTGTGWIPLPLLRRRLLDWLDPEQQWPGACLALQAPCLLTPEQHQRYRDSPATGADATRETARFPRSLASQLADRPGRLPSGPVRYWTTHPGSARTLAQRLDAGQAPAGPIERRAYLTVHDDDARERFIDFLREPDYPDDPLRRMEKDALFDYFVDRLDRSDERVQLTATVYRVLKAATYRRVPGYLDQLVAGVSDQLTAPLPLGGEYSDEVVRRVHPLVRAWLSAEHHWIDETRSGRTAAAPLIARRTRPTATEPLASWPPLAALLELSYDDIEPRPDREWAPLQAPAARLVRDCLFELLIGDDEAAAGLGSGILLVPHQRGAVRHNGTSGCTRDRAPAPRPPEPTVEELSRRELAQRVARAKRDRATKVIDLLSDLVERPVADNSDWVHQTEFVHESAVLLQTGQLPEPARQQELSTGLAGHLVRSICVDGRYPEEISQHLDSLNMLAVVLSTVRNRALGGMIGPALRHLRSLTDRAGMSFAFVPTLERCLTIVHSKENNYHHAELQLATSVGYLDGLLSRVPDHTQDYVKVREVAQQVALQASGVYMRLLELYLAEPVLLAEIRDPDQRWRLLRQVGWLGLVSSAYAYAELRDIERVWPLPDQKTVDRSATKRWLVNTRCMHMRGLLLQATLDAVEADRADNPQRRAALERATVRPLVDAVPAIFAEATSVAVQPNLANELTRIAMHYAFLSGMRPLTPGTCPHPLARHLAHPVRRPTDHRDHGLEFDLDRATDHLIANRNDAGVLACIEHPEVVAALERRSISPAVRRSRPMAPEQLRALSSYRRWRQMDREQQIQLSRTVTADMARHVGDGFDAGRAAMLRFLANRRPLR